MKYCLLHEDPERMRCSASQYILAAGPAIWIVRKVQQCSLLGTLELLFSPVNLHDHQPSLIMHDE